jgi:hypothetical protein
MYLSILMQQGPNECPLFIVSYELHLYIICK